MKYELTNIVKSDVQGKMMRRIRALKNFCIVKKGDLGGWVESEKNLSQEGDSWVFYNARVCDNALVSDNAQLFDNTVVSDRARVYGNAEVFDSAWIYSSASVYGDAQIYGRSSVSGFARVFGEACVSGNAAVSGRAHVFEKACVSGNIHVSGRARISKKIPSVTRSDGYTFIYVPDSNGVMRVIAGCRYFTMEEAREHWKRSRGGTPLGQETMKILDFLEIA